MGIVLRWTFRFIFWPMVFIYVLAFALVLGIGLWWSLLPFAVAVAGWFYLLPEHRLGGDKRWLIGSLVATGLLFSTLRAYIWDRPIPLPSVSDAIYEYPADDFAPFDGYDIPNNVSRFVIFRAEWAMTDILFFDVEMPSINFEPRDYVSGSLLITCATSGCDSLGPTIKGGDGTSNSNVGTINPVDSSERSNPPSNFVVGPRLSQPL
ncbi:MAG: hypothetical protein AAF125_21665, partial [Chloroflexota bacterium]